MPHDWLLLIYSIPREPTAPRVAVWRKLKRLGVLLLNDAAWVLPARDATREQLRWLAAEVAEAGGEALVWEARLAVGQEELLVEQFAAQVEGPYRQLLVELDCAGADVGALSRRYQQIAAQDYFTSGLSQQLRAALASAGRDDR